MNLFLLIMDCIILLLNEIIDLNLFHLLLDNNFNLIQTLLCTGAFIALEIIKYFQAYITMSRLDPYVYGSNDNKENDTPDNVDTITFSHQIASNLALMLEDENGENHYIHLFDGHQLTEDELHLLDLMNIDYRTNNDDGGIE